MNLMLTTCARLLNGRGSAHHAGSLRILAAVAVAIFRSPAARSVASLGSKMEPKVGLRAVEAMRTALAPGVCPVLRYSDERGGAFSGLVRSRFSEEQAGKGNAAAMKPRHL